MQRPNVDQHVDLESDKRLILASELTLALKRTRRRLTAGPRGLTGLTSAPQATSAAQPAWEAQLARRCCEGGSNGGERLQRDRTGRHEHGVVGEGRRGSHRAAEVSQALRREPTPPKLKVSFKYESKD